MQIMIKGYDAYSATAITDFVNNYKIPDNKGGYRNFEVNNVLPIVNYSLGKPTDINAASSMLKGADKAIKNLIPVYEARHTIYIKRGAMGFMASRKKDDSGIVALTSKEKKDAINELNFDYGLTGGARYDWSYFCTSGICKNEYEHF